VRRADKPCCICCGLVLIAERYRRPNLFSPVRARFADFGVERAEVLAGSGARERPGAVEPGLGFFVSVTRIAVGPLVAKIVAVFTEGEHSECSLPKWLADVPAFIPNLLKLSALFDNLLTKSRRVLRNPSLARAFLRNLVLNKNRKALDCIRPSSFPRTWGHTLPYG
jgi:hypothetical protein